MSVVSIYPPAVSHRTGELSRLLAAAVVNAKFRNLLLTNPAQALASGYLGESFYLAPEEEDLILSIQATSLAEFALQLTKRLNGDGDRDYHGRANSSKTS
jgi:hypothetical protein